MTASFSPAQLSELFTEIAEQLTSHEDGESTFRALSEIAIDRVPGTMYAGITIGHAGLKFETAGATDDLVRRADQIQYSLQSGPCVDAIIAHTTFNAGDLRSDPRWPQFGRLAYDATGIISMLSVRLYLESDLKIIAGINLYSEKPDAFDEASETIAVLLATHGSIAVGRAAARTKADNLRIALDSNREIGIAIGIVMANTKLPRDQAFDLLRIFSQHNHRKVADVAAQVAETGVLPQLPPTKR